jgi:hypothetical protein
VKIVDKLVSALHRIIRWFIGKKPPEQIPKDDKDITPEIKVISCKVKSISTKPKN